MLPLDAADVQADLDRRRPGASRFTTQRREPDEARILSGVMLDERSGRQVTTGAPIAIFIEKRRSAVEGLRRHQGQVSAGPCRLRLRGQIRHPRLSRRRPLLGA